MVTTKALTTARDVSDAKTSQPETSLDGWDSKCAGVAGAEIASWSMLELIIAIELEGCAKNAFMIYRAYSRQKQTSCRPANELLWKVCCVV